MNKFSKFIGKMPFCGKLVLRPYISSIYCSKNKQERYRQYLLLCIVLFFFIFLHYIQYEIGLKNFYNQEHWLPKIISIMYAAINISVCITQVYLIYRIGKFVFFNRIYRMRMIPKYSPLDSLCMIAFTIGMQLIFISVWS